MPIFCFPTMSMWIGWKHSTKYKYVLPPGNWLSSFKESCVSRSWGTCAAPCHILVHTTGKQNFQVQRKHLCSLWMSSLFECYIDLCTLCHYPVCFCFALAMKTANRVTSNETMERMEYAEHFIAVAADDVSLSRRLCRIDEAFCIFSRRPVSTDVGWFTPSAKYCWMCRAYVWALPLPSLIAADSPSNLCLITAMSFRRAANSDMILVSIAVRTSPTGWGLAWRGRVCWCSVLGPYCCTTTPRPPLISGNTRGVTRQSEACREIGVGWGPLKLKRCLGAGSRKSPSNKS